MSSITFSGLASGLDTAAIVEQLIGIKRRPILRLQAERSLFEKQKTALDVLKSKLLDLQKAAQKLDTANEFASLTATSSDEDLLTVAAGSGAAPGSYEIVVQTLAKAQKELSQGYDSRYDSVGEGTISFTVDGETTDLTLSGYTSLEGLKELINDNVEGVSATLIFDGSETGGYYLMLTGAEAGSAGAFTFDFSGLSGGITPTMTSQQTAVDATLTVDGIAVTASSNTVTDAISGLTLNLENADPLTSIHVDVEIDSEGVYEQVKGFVDAYNDVMTYLNAQTKNDGTLDGNLTARAVASRIESVFTSSLSDVGSITIFAQLGVTRGDERLYDFDKDKFLDALSESYGGVRDFFVQRDGNTGKAYLVDQAIESLTDNIDGLFKSGTKALDSRIDNIDDSIVRYERSVDSYRTTLERKFVAMERMVAQLQAQGNYLSSMVYY